MTLFERFGGQEGIADVVETFYQKVLDDNSINHFFANTDMAAQKRHQTAFLSFALGGPAYSGRSMERAHAGMNLQPEHFGAVAGHMVASLQEHGVAQEDTDAVFHRLLTLKDAVLYK
ncbi:MAG TPA: group 1 truncated hemoglobin [Symbiobacteriaceae bacterium]|nr:group 1 truncated hemoglobin [Symbiobacteriaceae bacterium]